MNFVNARTHSITASNNGSVTLTSGTIFKGDSDGEMMDCWSLLDTTNSSLESMAPNEKVQTQTTQSSNATEPRFHIYLNGKMRFLAKSQIIRST